MKPLKLLFHSFGLFSGSSTFLKIRPFPKPSYGFLTGFGSTFVDNMGTLAPLGTHAA